jgi:hypothetical protein
VCGYLNQTQRSEDQTKERTKEVEKEEGTSKLRIIFTKPPKRELLMKKLLRISEFAKQLLSVNRV